MEAELRSEMTRLSERVTVLEVQQPHNAAALVRIEKSVERLNGHLLKGVWIVFGLFITALWSVVTRAGMMF